MEKTPQVETLFNKFQTALNKFNIRNPGLVATFLWIAVASVLTSWIIIR